MPYNDPEKNKQGRERSDFSIMRNNERSESDLDIKKTQLASRIGVKTGKP